ncbi:hypothetical protein DFR40_0141 [Azonexus fungiphilus]|uniref:Uncharacterized protein n=1 Tax=Azonexus fungiphilus TaxID=146940 RepID=A0A495WMN8_9RHOO|nr:hypothetical protein [Azonexus fungiphilus]RKT63091.1 hypothetical protein DFR40_0141 [Azonexus fungiphilus]
MLRIPQRNPHRFPMDRLGEYIRQFAELLGQDNMPVFKGIKNASVGIRAAIPENRTNNTFARIVQAKSDPKSRAAKVLQGIQNLLGEDGIPEAELLDSSSKVIYLFKGNPADSEQVSRVFQHGSIDGIVTGLVGADDTMHLHLRDYFDRDMRLVIRDEALARELVLRFRQGSVRLNLHGQWVRTDSGWIPESGKCIVTSFEDLDDMVPSEVFRYIAEVPDNGWLEFADPQTEWTELRGLQ